MAQMPPMCGQKQASMRITGASPGCEVYPLCPEGNGSSDCWRQHSRKQFLRGFLGARWQPSQCFLLAGSHRQPQGHPKFSHTAHSFRDTDHNAQENNSSQAKTKGYLSLLT
ncbi:hypothetical protein DPEC_G00272870 [Dallia pectoralis]|uniref:Uncharacterized protein n=1 Tax=Dallia pectoralis TaxID=75939 RepID=A0ACC2FQ81_DALPE|nr:hypothetical protein DPEC_G00272870 [Dallia pectoralis]